MTTTPVPPLDTRRARTRQAIFDALTSLIFTRRYSAIRTADLIKAAGVGRSTFYEHFRGKDDVLVMALDPVCVPLAAAATGQAERGALRSVLTHLREHRALSRVLFEPRVLPRLQRKLAGLIEARLGETAGAPTPPAMVAMAASAGQLAMLRMWLAGEASCSIEAIESQLLAWRAGALASTSTAESSEPSTERLPMSQPAGDPSIRPFVPAKDFAVSKAFYAALGFQTFLDVDDVVIFGFGASRFLLQRYYQKEWAENFMLQLMVDDLDAWWDHIRGLDLVERFGVAEPKPPSMQPWGLRIAYLIDPSGVLWHIAERRPGEAIDL